MLPVIEGFGLKIISFTLTLILGVFFSLFIMIGQCFKYGLKFRSVITCLAVSIPFVFLGGKLIYVLTTLNEGYSFSDYVVGGFVYYGGMIGLFAGVYIYAGYTRQSFFKYADFIAPYVALGQTFGRIGCFLNGCCYGIASNSIISVRYPEWHPTFGAAVLPVPLFESTACFILYDYQVKSCFVK